MDVRALIFDFDGLILDTETPMRDSWQEIFDIYQITMPAKQWAHLVGSSVDPPELYDFLEAHLGEAVHRAALREQRMVRELELLSKNGVLPGVRELIGEARTRGLRLAVASSSDHAWVDGLLETHGLYDRFDSIVCSDDVHRTKPHPDLYCTTLERLAVRAVEAIAFEDSQHGVTAAKKAGLFCVAVPNEITRSLAFEAADLVVSSLDRYDLSGYIRMASCR